MQPLYSCIIPIYNAEYYLKRCIDSICNQINKNIEIILVNDGSTDNSGALCDKYASKDSRIKVFHKPNGGVSSARNYGIAKAKGKWITFIDADDYIDANYFPNNEYSDSDLLIQNWGHSNNIDIKDKLDIGDYTNKSLQDFYNKHLHLLLFLVPWAKFFRKDIIIKYNILFNTNFKVSEDSLFVTEYLRSVNKLTVVATSTYRYTLNTIPFKYQTDINTTILYTRTYLKAYNHLRYKNKGLLASTYQGCLNNLKDKDNPRIFYLFISNTNVKKIFIGSYNNTFIGYLFYFKLLMVSFYKLLGFQLCSR